MNFEVLSVHVAYLDIQNSLIFIRYFFVTKLRMSHVYLQHTWQHHLLGGVKLKLYVLTVPVTGFVKNSGIVLGVV